MNANELVKTCLFCGKPFKPDLAQRDKQLEEHMYSCMKKCPFN